MTPPGLTVGGVLPLADRKQIDAACDRFEAAWHADARPDFASILDGQAPGPARVRLFRELLALDLEFRRGAGERPALASYRARFPEFVAVIDALDGLITLNGASTSNPTGGDAPTRPGTDPRRSEGGAGPAEALREAGFEVLDELGRGGMGVVYRAFQPSLSRHVALKVIKAAEFATEGELRRFRNEAEAVAMLDHPHIIPIFEVGQSRGLHYFSMKLVAGASLDRRLDEFADDPRAAARLVAIAAEAVHHAHRRGLIHRDLKPANILVDERGEPYVTDFGLARPIAADGGLTRTGMIVGTPSYMSPEQATGGQGEFTTATDVYGLGAVLYALLTGRAPHGGSSLLETLDKVRGVAPEPPSRLNLQVPRDLEIICLKCLEKDPRRRFDGAHELADDLRRWLSGRPINARPIGPLTRARMWCRRHPLPAALATLLVVSIVGGFAGMTWKWREADRNATRSARLVDYLANRVIAESSTEQNPHAANLTVRALLDRTASRIGGDFQDEPEVEAAIREMVGWAYGSLGAFDRAVTELQKVVNLDTDLYGPEHPTTLRAAGKLAALLDESGQLAEAESLARRNLAASRRIFGIEAPASLEAAERLGTILRERRGFAEAESLLRGTLDARRRFLPTDHPDTLGTIHQLCLLLLDLRRFDEAETLALAYEQGIRCAWGPKHPGNITALANRGLIRLLQGRSAEAEPFYRQAAAESRRILGPDHPRTRAAVADHARVLHAIAVRLQDTRHETRDMSLGR
jgi:tetratricopeptide (TPR) repeat protein